MRNNTYSMHPHQNNCRLGRLGEDFAAEVLKTQGYEILERNYRCKIGEIDIIAGRGSEICFIEVKTRNSVDFGRPAESVNERKQRTIRQIASLYLSVNRLPDADISFQVIEIHLNQIENAF